MSEIKVTEENPKSAKIYTYDPNMSDDELEVQLPKPVGYRVLVAMPEVEKTFDGTNVLKTDAAIHNEHIMSIIGMVLDMGDQAYNDKERFPNGPWCKQGDWVIFARYAGSRLPIEGGEVRLLNDDEVLGTIKDPESVLHYI